MSTSGASKKHGGRPIEALGGLVRQRRGTRTLREVAMTIDVSAATLLRIESGRIPDVETFGKICRWLEMDPGVFLGSQSAGSAAQPSRPTPVQVSAHFRAERAPRQETISALAAMLLFAARAQQRPDDSEPNEPPTSGV
jgi:transcriptional regulator with XRE-family HTH domain